MDHPSPEDIQAAVAPIASLLSKSEKAQQKLAPGTWQHTMLQDNIRALRIAAALLAEEPHQASRQDLQDALRALRSMIARTEGAQPKFAPGMSQHTLQRNRLKALQVAESLVSAEMGDD